MWQESRNRKRISLKLLIRNALLFIKYENLKDYYKKQDAFDNR